MGVAQIMLDDLDLSNIVIGWYKLFGTSSLVSVPPNGPAKGSSAGPNPPGQNSGGLPPPPNPNSQSQQPATGSGNPSASNASANPASIIDIAMARWRVTFEEILFIIGLRSHTIGLGQEHI